MAAEQHQKPSQRRTERDDGAERNRLEKALEIGLEDTFPRPMQLLPFSLRQQRDYQGDVIGSVGVIAPTTARLLRR